LSTASRRWNDSDLVLDDLQLGQLAHTARERCYQLAGERAGKAVEKLAATGSSVDPASFDDSV
jgi:hypothetical protein